MSARTLVLPVLCLLLACSSDDGMGPGGGGTSNRLPNAIISTGGAALPRVFLDGETVVVTAASTDLDGDTLTHTWSLGGTAPGQLSATTGSSVTWTAGASAGNAVITLVSNDGTGNSPVPANLSLLTGTAVAPGDIANGTVWSKAQAPYVVVHDIRVPLGSTLSAEPGVEIFFRGTAIPSGGGYNKPDFAIEGSFNPRGSGTSSSTAVTLRGGRNITAMQWSGLRFSADEPMESRLVNCNIEEAETGVSVAGTGEVFVYNARIRRNATGVSMSDPKAVGGEGVISTATLRRVVVSESLGVGVLVASSTLTLRQCRIRDNASTGLTVSSSSDPATADADSCIFSANGGSGGANLSFDNISGNTYALNILMQHSNFGVDVDNAPNNVNWGGCAGPAFLQDFDLTGNFWGVIVNAQSGLDQILATMTGYSGCVDDPSDWLLANGDWAISPHSTGAP